jgi:hypothetical protein
MLELISLQLPNEWLKTGYLFNYVRAGILFLEFGEDGKLKSFQIPPPEALVSTFDTGVSTIRVQASREEREALVQQLDQHWTQIRHLRRD